MHSKSYWKRSMGIGVSLALFVLAGNAFGQDVSKAEDAALNQAVSSQEVIPPPRDGTGAGVEAFGGIEAAVADDGSVPVTGEYPIIVTRDAWAVREN